MSVGGCGTVPTATNANQDEVEYHRSLTPLLPLAAAAAAVMMRGNGMLSSTIFQTLVRDTSGMSVGEGSGYGRSSTYLKLSAKFHNSRYNISFQMTSIHFQITDRSPSPLSAYKKQLFKHI